MNASILVWYLAFFTKESYQDTDQLLRECKNEWTTVTHDLKKPFETGLTTFIRLSKAIFLWEFFMMWKYLFQIGNRKLTNINYDGDSKF